MSSADPSLPVPRIPLVPTMTDAAKSVQMRFTMGKTPSGVYERFYHRTYIAMLEAPEQSMMGTVLKAAEIV